MPGRARSRPPPSRRLARIANAVGTGLPMNMWCQKPGIGSGAADARRLATPRPSRAGMAAVAREQAAAAKTRTIGLGRRELARLRGWPRPRRVANDGRQRRRRIVNDEHGPGSADHRVLPGFGGITALAPSAQRQPECQNVHGHRPSGGGGEPSQSTTRRSDPRRREGRRRRVFAMVPRPAGGRGHHRRGHDRRRRREAPTAGAGGCCRRLQCAQHVPTERAPTLKNHARETQALNFTKAVRGSNAPLPPVVGFPQSTAPR